MSTYASLFALPGGTFLCAGKFLYDAMTSPTVQAVQTGSKAYQLASKLKSECGFCSNEKWGLDNECKYCDIKYCNECYDQDREKLHNDRKHLCQLCNYYKTNIKSSYKCGYLLNVCQACDKTPLYNIHQDRKGSREYCGVCWCNMLNVPRICTKCRIGICQDCLDDGYFRKFHRC